MHSETTQRGSRAPHAATRREFVFAATGLGAAGLPLLASAEDARTVDGPGEGTAGSRRRSLRIAHLTDIHVQPERGAARGLAQALEHVQSLPETHGLDAVDLIITGGDTIMDALEVGRDRTKTQWELWRKAKADHCSLPVRSVIGNHDVWGWTRSRAGTNGEEPLYGKQWACEEFGREKPYESFDLGGWHIVLLDSTFPHGESYIGRLDESQFDWFARDLAAVPEEVPVLVVSHIPILSVHPLAAAKAAPQEAGGLPVFTTNGNLVHTDHSRIRGLFRRHRNVKAAASGHLHILEQIDFEGVRYVCNGAVSAGWWRGLHRGTDFGYGLVDLYDDGTLESRYLTYDWKVQA